MCSSDLFPSHDRPGGGADWTLSKTNTIDTYTIKTGYDKAIIEVGNSVFPANGNIEDLILLGEYGGKPGSATQYIQLSAKQAAGNGQINFANKIWQIPFNYTDNPDNRVFTLKAIKTSGAITLKPHPLEDIDKTREEILSLGSQEGLIQFEAGKGNITQEYLKDLIQLGTEFYSANPQMGLVVKTYQSDIFNNWINTEWIDGENGINAITAVDVSDGKLELDTLILAKKA